MVTGLPFRSKTHPVWRGHHEAKYPRWEKDRSRRLLTIYAPVIYTAPCIMFWMGAYTLRGEVGGGWALEFPSFLGPVKWERADRRVPFGAQIFVQHRECG